MTIVNILILTSHMYLTPYSYQSSRSPNQVETISLTILTILSAYLSQADLPLPNLAIVFLCLAAFLPSALLVAYIFFHETKELCKETISRFGRYSISMNREDAGRPRATSNSDNDSVERRGTIDTEAPVRRDTVDSTYGPPSLELQASVQASTSQETLLQMVPVDDSPYKRTIPSSQDNSPYPEQNVLKNDKQVFFANPNYEAQLVQRNRDMSATGRSRDMSTTGRNRDMSTSTLYPQSPSPYDTPHLLPILDEDQTDAEPGGEGGVE